MKKSILMFSMTTLLLIGGMNMVSGQDKPKTKKDTVNIDTDAKPTFFYAVEDEKSGANGGSGKSNLLTIAIIAGVVVVAAGGFFLIQKKKK